MLDQYPTRHCLMTQPNFDPWAYTFLANEAFGDSYKGRPRIARDTRIAGGIYFGTYEGEAITVDTLGRHEAYDQLFYKASLRAENDGDGILNAIYATVKESMPYDSDGVDRLLAMLGTTNGGEVDLSLFINAGVAECRHQALAAGVLLERFIHEGSITGSVSVDRSMELNPETGEAEGHAWARYTSPRNEVWIVDVAGEYNGPLEYSPGISEWNYFRPEDSLRAIGVASVTPNVAWEDLGQS